MPTAVTAFHFSLYFSAKKSSPASSSIKPPITEQAITLPKSLLHKHPLWSLTHRNISFQFKEKILCLEIMGVDSGRALAQNPILHTASLHSIHSIINFLESKGIQQKELGRIFGMCPRILTSDITINLNPVFNFISHDLKVPDQYFRRVINKCPSMLDCSARDQLKPTLFYLQRLGFKDLHALAYQDPILLVSSVENTLIPKLDYLISLGFSRNDAVGMARRCPRLFTFNIENNLKPKFEYFVEEMKGAMEQLKEFPEYFAYSLEKRIKPRHIEVVHDGVDIPLPILLKSADDDFRVLLKAAKEGG